MVVYIGMLAAGVIWLCWLNRRYKNFKRTDKTSSPAHEVIFLHRDMGYGGAERLILDIAIFFTQQPRPDLPCRIFTTTIAKGWTSPDPRIQIQLVGRWLPARVFKKFFAVCSVVKIFYLTFYSIVIHTFLGWLGWMLM